MRALYALALPLIVWLAVVAIGTAQLDALTPDSLTLGHSAEREQSPDPTNHYRPASTHTRGDTHMSTTPTPEERQAFAAAYEAAMADFGHPASDVAPSVGCGRHPENPACTCDVAVDSPTPVRYDVIDGRYVERDFDLRKLVDIDALVDSVHGLVNRVPPRDGGWTAADDVLSGLALLGAATDTAGAFHAHHELAELMERVASDLDDDSA